MAHTPPTQPANQEAGIAKNHLPIKLFDKPLPSQTLTDLAWNSSPTQPAGQETGMAKTTYTFEAAETELHEHPHHPHGQQAKKLNH